MARSTATLVLLLAVVSVAVMATVAEGKRRHRHDYESESQQDYDNSNKDGGKLRSSSNEIDTGKSSERDSSEEDEQRRHHRHHGHHGHHHHHHHRHHRRHHHDDDEFRQRKMGPLEEMRAFYRKFTGAVRVLANEANLSPEDIQKLLVIIEENWSEMKVEDRSDWTEEQWQQSKEDIKRRKENIKREAYDQIEDHERLTVFFDKLRKWKTALKATYRRHFEILMIRMAERSGLDDSDIERFLVELDVHAKPKGVHWRPGMSENEKAKNNAIHKRNWYSIKRNLLKNASEDSRERYERFFGMVERFFKVKRTTKSKTGSDEDSSERSHRRHHHSGVSRFVGHHRHSHHRRHHSLDNDSSSRTDGERDYRRERRQHRTSSED